MAEKTAGTIVDIPACLKGKITPRDVIAASGAFMWKTDASYITSQLVGETGYFFKVVSLNYSLEVGSNKRLHGFYKNQPVYNQFFYIARNDQWLEQVIFGPFKLLAVGDVYLFAMWEPSQLSLLFLDKFDQREIAESSDGTEIDKKRRILKTPPTIPPYSLVDWARKEAIAPVITYDSLFHFYEEVVSSLQSIPDKVRTIGMYNSFWDITYKGSKIVSRQPKRETDVLPTIHGLLFDIAIAKNFQISPEHQIAGGRLDFLLSGSLKTGETANVCVEFKHAHSPHLVDGLVKQLPAYMKAKGGDFGVYCVLYFKGPHFSKPHEYDDAGQLILSLIDRVSLAGLSGVVRILTFDFSHPRPPSEI